MQDNFPDPDFAAEQLAREMDREEYRLEFAVEPPPSRYFAATASPLSSPGSSPPASPSSAAGSNRGGLRARSESRGRATRGPAKVPLALIGIVGSALNIRANQ